MRDHHPAGELVRLLYVTRQPAKTQVREQLVREPNAAAAGRHGREERRRPFAAVLSGSMNFLQQSPSVSLRLPGNRSISRANSKTTTIKRTHLGQLKLDDPVLVGLHHPRTISETL